MQTPISKKIEIGANVAIIVVATLLATVVVKNYLWLSNQASSRETIVPKLTALDIDWSQNKQTLVLALSSNCRFCTESAEFYKELMKQRNSTRVIAVLPQITEEGRRYLQDLGVAVDEVRQAPLHSMNIAGTPTLVLVNSKGEVIGEWVGKLERDQQVEILKRIV